MEKQINRCPVCNRTPCISYACGEHFIEGRDGCRFCGIDGRFREMHASEEGEIDAWNLAAENEAKFECPLGGDETNDCQGCSYAGDYHFVKGECVMR